MRVFPARENSLLRGFMRGGSSRCRAEVLRGGRERATVWMGLSADVAALPGRFGGHRPADAARVLHRAGAAARGYSNRAAQCDVSEPSGPQRAPPCSWRPCAAPPRPARASQRGADPFCADGNGARHWNGGADRGQAAFPSSSRCRPCRRTAGTPRRRPTSAPADHWRRWRLRRRVVRELQRLASRRDAAPVARRLLRAGPVPHARAVAVAARVRAGLRDLEAEPLGGERGRGALRGGDEGTRASSRYPGDARRAVRRRRREAGLDKTHTARDRARRRTATPSNARERLGRSGRSKSADASRGP